MIGPVGDYRDIYVASCGQQFATHAQGIDHERDCPACMREQMMTDMEAFAYEDDEPDNDGPYLREDDL
jgi:hypothetical protein